MERPDRKGREQLFSKYIAPLKVHAVWYASASSIFLLLLLLLMVAVVRGSFLNAEDENELCGNPFCHLSDAQLLDEEVV